MQVSMKIAFFLLNNVGLYIINNINSKFCHVSCNFTFPMFNQGNFLLIKKE